MSTLKELITKHKTELDEHFKAKYPNGQFVVIITILQVNIDKNTGIITPDGHTKHYHLFWNKKRITSHSRPIGIGVSMSETEGMTTEYFESSICSACGKKRKFTYSTLNECIAKAKDLSFPDKIIQSFISNYQNKDALIQDWYNKRYACGFQAFKKDW